MGFVVNPYDPCIANKIVDGHQVTLQSHVDNLMISHVDMLAINDFLRELKVIYSDTLTESTKTSTPAGDHLFKIREDGRKLDDEMQMACWLSSRQYATFLGACCLEVTIETTCRVEIIVYCDTKKEMKMKIMRLKVGSKNGPRGVLLTHDLVPGQLQDYHDLVPGHF
jgi:hypothetical protein